MVREYKANDLVIQWGENPSAVSRDEALKHNEFSQYTNVDALFAIIKNKNMKFARLDKVNDLMEIEQLYDDKYKNLVYISCFSFRKTEYIPHWIMYTKLGYGVRITFELEDGKQLSNEIIDSTRPLIGIRNDWAKCDLKKEYKDLFVDYNTRKILYTEDRINKCGFSGVLDIASAAVHKHKDWDFEDEVRMRLLLRPIKDLVADLDFEFFLAPIKFDNINITITFSPWMASSLKEEVREFCGRHLPKAKCIDSSLEGAVAIK